MTDLVKSLKIGNNSYSIKDEKATPYLSAEDESKLLFDNTYRGQEVEKADVFVKADGSLIEKTKYAPFIGKSTLPAESWYTLAYGSNTWVAFASGKAYYSTNHGDSWTAITFTDTYSGLRIVRYADSQFIALPINGSYLQYSTNGINWTYAASSLPSAQWRDLIYANNKYTAIAKNGKVASSSNGHSFTQATTTLTSGGSWMGIAYGNNKYVAVGSGSTPYAAYSTDGDTWTEITNFVDASGWQKVAFGANKFVAVSEHSKYCAISEDGINWTKSLLHENISNWHSIVYRNGMFITVSYGNNVALISSDGTHWSEIGLPSISNWTAVEYGDSHFIAVADGSSTIACQDVTKTLSLVKGGYTGTNANVFFSNNQFVATGKNSRDIFFSPDGFNWTKQQLNSDTVNWLPVAYGNGRWVILSEDSNNAAAYSTDGGVTWVDFTLDATPTKWKELKYTNGAFIGIASDTNKAIYSTDGINWSEKTLPATASWVHIAVGDSAIIAIAKDTSTAARSTDGGVTWVSTTLPTATAYGNIAYGNGTFVVTTASNGTLAVYSTDEGATWSTSTLPSKGSWFNAVFVDNIFVAARPGEHHMAVSYDSGVTWSEVLLDNTTAFGFNAVYSNDRVVSTVSGDRCLVLKTIENTSTKLSYTKAEIDSKGYLQNTATGPNSLTIGGTAAGANCVSLGNSAVTSNNNSVAVGESAFASYFSCSIGRGSKNRARGAVLLGTCGFNSEDKTFKVALSDTSSTINPATNEASGLYTVLDSSGNIPAARLSNIYEIVQTMPASPTSGKIYFVTGS